MYKKPSAQRGIKQAYENLLDANLRDKVPAWLWAMRSVPPVDSLVRAPTQFSTKGKLEFEAGDNTEKPAHNTTPKARIERQLPKGCVSIRHNKTHLRTRNARPPKIVFPEDELRKDFYENHPFEKYRPRIMMETDGKNNSDWSQISHGTNHVTGENVIRYQYYLMQTAGMSKQEAYAQATSEFYKIRAREEMEAKIAKQEARFYGARSLEKPFSAHQLILEERHIRKGSKVVEQRQEAQRIHGAMSGVDA
ncbi:mitochondrial ribosomal small subunit component [Coemansia spiralis]|uniref:Small ribosomal subunit protein mS23 n=2 Tax=Coemansia TaxID=4863 RepID=A0A9W8KV14_9FUNG|nr:mitochondrial ribosomal protein S25 [Coemansia spiralis]KAJ1989098.1 mitochondrial ribosomal small subunit component [Coemansia umbellata]KAJ2620224.1 mitochondrial ribosomal small subunit component [Coemansia sp. RSA 1358]KAJ2672552.1 mitochondrial ribosomal small subunit component [Coemansia spiralis]